MICSCYLVQIDIKVSQSLDTQCQTSGSYYYYFLAKLPLDAGNSDNSNRWCPDWYHYSRDYILNDILFDDYILFRANMSPDHSTYIQWIESVDLLNETWLLLDRFDFEYPSPTNCTRQTVASGVWLQLFHIDL